MMLRRGDCAIWRVYGSRSHIGLLLVPGHHCFPSDGVPLACASRLLPASGESHREADTYLSCRQYIPATPVMPHLSFHMLDTRLLGLSSVPCQDGDENLAHLGHALGGPSRLSQCQRP